MKEFDPLDFHSQEQAIKLSEELSRIEAKNQEEDLKWLMSDKRGRRFIWRLLSRCGVFRSSFTGNSATFFNEGQRNVGLMLLSDIHEHCAERYVSMIGENKNAKRNTADGSRNK